MFAMGCSRARVAEGVGMGCCVLSGGRNLVGVSSFYSIAKNQILQNNCIFLSMSLPSSFPCSNLEKKI